MSRRETDVFVVWDESFTEYNFGPNHPMHPLRLDLTAKLASDFGLFDHARVHIGEAPRVDEDGLAALHTPEFIAAVKEAESTEELDETTVSTYGVGTEDVPRFEKIHEASGRIFQGSVEAARAISSQRFERAVNFCGGMHHAMPGRASGFCVYNDVAGAIRHFLDNGYERVAYIDLDAHHGDGTENFFWDDPRVLTISIHENGRFLFPGTGFANDIGGMSAAASAINIALPPRANDPDWLRAIDAVVPPVLREFGPQVIVSQHGCDGHRLDPLTHLRLSVDAMRVAAEWVRDLADEFAEGRWLATGGGGYALVDVVPRAWVNLVAIAAGADIAPGTEVPERWRDYVQAKAGLTAPMVMTDGHDGAFDSWRNGFDPESDLDRTVMATRKNIFPFYGLDAYYD
jgi:acetoin utilization protein AcuC